MKQFSPLEKKRPKRFKFLKCLTLAELAKTLNFPLSTLLNSHLKAQADPDHNPQSLKTSVLKGYRFHFPHWHYLPQAFAGVPPRRFDFELDKAYKAR